MDESKSITSLGDEITPSEAYQLDSDEYDSGDDEELEEEEYTRLVEEAENGYSDEMMDIFTHNLKEMGLVNFLRDYLTPDSQTGEIRSLRKLLLGFDVVPPRSLLAPNTPNVLLLPYTKLALSRLLRKRQRLTHLSSLDDAVDLLRNSKRIIILSGAGISTSCGIPDFRSANGLYANLQAEGKYELDDPQQMFDIQYFRQYPEVFYSFAKKIYPSNFVPSSCHRWIKMLEDKGKLLRNYTQNIDTLESLAGVTRVLQCHGSFKTASCLRCKTRVPGKSIEPYIMSQQIPFCGPCGAKRHERLEQRAQIKEALKLAKKKSKGKEKARDWEGEDESDEEDGEDDGWEGGEPGIIKPDITFFGQALDSEFDQCLFRDREQVDLLVVIGTSLKVAPVSEVLSHIPHSVPQIYINLTPVHHVHPDICLLGDADSIVKDLSSKLGWTIPPPAAIPSPATAAAENGDLGNLQSANTDGMEWFSGQGDCAHIHRFCKPGEYSSHSLDEKYDAQTDTGSNSDSRSEDSRTSEDSVRDSNTVLTYNVNEQGEEKYFNNEAVRNEEADGDEQGSESKDINDHGVGEGGGGDQSGYVSDAESEDAEGSRGSNKRRKVNH